MNGTSRGITQRTLAAVAMVILGVGTALIGLVGVASTANATNHNDGKGANQSGPFDPSNVGGGDHQGNGKAPGNGTVGKADGKNPPGQMKNGKDKGYECADNKGVGDKGGNPAHSGCAPGQGDGDGDGDVTCPNGLAPQDYNLDGVTGEQECTPVKGIESEIPGDGDGDGDGDGGAEVLGIEANAPAAVPTAVDAGLTGQESGNSTLWLLAGAALALTGAAFGLTPARARGKRAR